MSGKLFILMAVLGLLTLEITADDPSATFANCKLVEGVSIVISEYFATWGFLHDDVFNFFLQVKVYLSILVL